LQCKPDNAVRDFNAAMAVSGPMVAACANSPSLFGRQLWAETRIPLFEQSVDIGPHYPQRVDFGTGFAEGSLFELFEENQRDHPILIPAVADAAPGKFAHARFHNGTIWRWNRPLIGFDHDGQVHLRIEHRAVSAGPTIRDCVANAALFFGLVRGLSMESDAVGMQLAFEAVRANFYAAARRGIGAELLWHGGPVTAQDLLLEELLPLARRGLASYGIPEAEINQHLKLVEARVASGQNGAAWQQRWVRENGMQVNGLVMAYLERQNQGEPVHTWTT